MRVERTPGFFESCNLTWQEFSSGFTNIRGPQSMLLNYKRFNWSKSYVSFKFPGFFCEFMQESERKAGFSHVAKADEYWGQTFLSLQPETEQ